MNQSRGSEVSEAGFCLLAKKSLFILGCVQGSIILLVCVTFVVFSTDSESGTRPISTNPGSMQTSEYGLTRGTCFVARRREVVAVAGAAVDFVVCFGCGGISFFRFFSSNAHGLRQVYGAALPHLPLY